MTEWRWVPGHEGRYEVSNQGSVRSWASGKPRPLKSYRRQDSGYQQVVLTPGRSLRFVHSLVLTAFVGPRPEGHTASHLNGDPGDNRPENLAWQTHSDNCRLKGAHGTAQRGERNGWSKLTDEAVRTMRARRRAGTPVPSLAREYGLSLGHAYKVVNGEAWTHVV